MIVKTRAVILRETKYRDQSKICSVYTREFGKISVIIKGARNPKNKLSGLFSAGNVVDLVLYKKNSRDIQLVSDGNLILSPMVPAPDLDRFAVLYRIIDLVKQTTEHDEKNLSLFTLLAGTLEKLSTMMASITSSFMHGSFCDLFRCLAFSPPFVSVSSAEKSSCLQLSP